MSWECPECMHQNEAGNVCESCGYCRKTNICLTSSRGLVFESGIDFKVDRRVYKDIESDYQYLQRSPGSYQFQLVMDTNSPSGWGLRTSACSDMDTLINNVICESDVVYPLADGDVITIGSRIHPGATAAPLRVSFGG